MENWIKKNIPDMSGKLVVITGANSGLGYESAKILAQHDARVIMAGRNESKLSEARERILSYASGADIETRILDLADLASVKAFAEAMRLKFSRIDVLMNNAGVMATPYGQTKDGFELQFGTNHLGHFALTASLFPLLRNTSGSRVVTISSLAARSGAIHFDDLMLEKKYNRMKAYRQAKLANLMFALELNERLMHTDYKTISLSAHPGMAETNLFYNMQPPWMLRMLGNAIMPMLTQSAAKGALPQLYAATSPDAEAGGYYGPDGKREYKGLPDKAFIPEAAKDQKARQKLWEKSEELTGVKFDLKKQS
jgi:NAD(P)-dependent dehydrogenase (short-subunit alcohol dehydrogenase family)